MIHKIQTHLLVFVITLLALIGCSDMPYTGSSMLTANDVDRYITSKDGETYCLVNGPDSACLTLAPTVETRHADAPIIHIYPQKIVYVFYREGVPVLTAEKVVDTTEIVEKLTDPEPEPQPSEEIEPQPVEESEPEPQPEPEPEPEIESPVYIPPSEDLQPEPDPQPEPPPPIVLVEETPPPENTQPQPPTVDPSPPPPPPRRTNTGDEWLIKVYYDVDPLPLEEAEEYIRTRTTLANSGFTITINGESIDDDDITSRAGIVERDTNDNGLHRPGFQFIYRTTATKLMIEVSSDYSGPVEQLKISGF